MWGWTWRFQITGKGNLPSVVIEGPNTIPYATMGVARMLDRLVIVSTLLVTLGITANGRKVYTYKWTISVGMCLASQPQSQELENNTQAA